MQRAEKIYAIPVSCLLFRRTPFLLPETILCTGGKALLNDSLITKRLAESVKTYGKSPYGEYLKAGLGIEFN